MRQIRVIQGWNPVEVQREVNRFLLEQPRIFHGKEEISFTTAREGDSISTTVMIVHETGLAPGPAPEETP